MYYKTDTFKYNKMSVGWNLNDSATFHLPNISFYFSAKLLHSTKMENTLTVFTLGWSMTDAATTQDNSILPANLLGPSGKNILVKKCLYQYKHHISQCIRSTRQDDWNGAVS